MDVYCCYCTTGRQCGHRNNTIKEATLLSLGESQLVRCSTNLVPFLEHTPQQLIFSFVLSGPQS